jgi:hypothetical protein
MQPLIGTLLDKGHVFDLIVCSYFEHLIFSFFLNILTLVENRASVPVGFGLQSRLRNRD